jgi:mono/diheme cytochrome c family protein
MSQGFFAAIAFALALNLIVPWPAGAQALSPPERRGLTFVQVHCGQCHAIGRVGDSPLRVAPPFRDLHRNYPVESLEEALAEGITTGHPSMPEFQLDPGQIRDVISYLKSLER